MIGFIGAGNIATAIITGVDYKDIGVFDTNKETIQKYKSQNYTTYSSIEELIKNCDTIVLSVIQTWHKNQSW